MRGHTVTVHQGLMYVIGGKLQGCAVKNILLLCSSCDAVVWTACSVRQTTCGVLEHLSSPFAFHTSWATRGHSNAMVASFVYSTMLCVRRGKDASAHIHILSLPHVLNRKPALKASVQVSFKIWDHAACLLPPSPAMPHGCICVVAGRATSKLGFSNQAFLINPDPNHFDALTIPIRCESQCHH